MEYRAVVIRDIIRDINKSHFLPAIQREFVWKPERIEKLFDSIMGDYPIGSFLFWKLPPEKKNDWAIYEFIRDFDGENPHNNPANMNGITRDVSLILDGQQRITSLFIGLRGSYRFLYYRWRNTKLYLNLLKKAVPNDENPEELTYQFEFRESPEPSNGNKELWYEVGKILDYDDAEEAKDALRDAFQVLSEDDVRNANSLVGRLHSRIHTKPTISYYEERTPSYDKVLEIFVRANSGGVTLEYSDLLLSTATAKWEKLDARNEIHSFTDEINGTGSGYNFGKDFVLKGCLYLTGDLPIAYKVQNFIKSNLLQIEDNWENIETYLSLTIRLISKFGFNSKNIVAPLALLPVSYFLLKKGKPTFDKSSDADDVKIQSEIRKWLIVVLLQNAFGSSTDNKLKSLRDILNAAPNFDVFPTDDLNAKLAIQSAFNDNEINQFLGYGYQGRYTFLVLSLLYPGRDWKDAVFHEDHIFPKSEFTEAKLRARGYDKDRIDRYMSTFNSVLNLQLLTDTENLSKNATPFEDWLKTRDEDFRKRHHIPVLQSYSMDAYEDFISARKAAIAPILKNL